MSEEILYTVPEVAKLMKTNSCYVYKLIHSGVLPVLKLRSYKVRRAALEQFLEKYEGKDLTNPYEVRDIDLDEKRSNVGA